MSECKNCKHGYSTPSGATQAAHIQTAETTEVRSWTSLPLLNVNEVPDDLDLICGSNKAYRSWRIPATYFLPGGALNNNQYKAAGEVELQARQIMPVYIVNDSLTPIVAARAATGETATDIAVSSADGTTTLMNSGYYTFARPHMYEVGKTYYLSQTTEGEVVSVKPNAGIVQALFTVVDQTTISIKIDEPRS